MRRYNYDRGRGGISIIIPAAGMGRRMKSYGPKPLIELAGRETVIGRQIRLVRWAFPTADITVVVGHEAERIVAVLPPGVRIVENERYDETNVVRSLLMGLRVALHGRVLIIYGDLVFNEATLSAIASQGSAVLVDSRGQMDADEVGVTIVDGRVTCFAYGLPVKWAQVAFLAGRELTLFARIARSPEMGRRFGFEVLNAVIDAGGRMRAIEPRGLRIVEIDASRDIDRARSIDEVV